MKILAAFTVCSCTSIVPDSMTITGSHGETSFDADGATEVGGEHPRSDISHWDGDGDSWGTSLGFTWNLGGDREAEAQEGLNARMDRLIEAVERLRRDGPEVEPCPPPPVAPEPKQEPVKPVVPEEKFLGMSTAQWTSLVAGLLAVIGACAEFVRRKRKKTKAAPKSH